MIKINENIRKLRLSKNLSQQHIADELNLSVGAYSNIENGRADITFRRLEQIAKILETNVIQLIIYQNTEAENLNLESKSLYERILIQDKEIIEILKSNIVELKEKAELYKSLYEECKKKNG